MTIQSSLSLTLMLASISGCAHVRPPLPGLTPSAAERRPVCPSRSAQQDDAVMAMASLVIEIAAASQPGSWPAVSGLITHGQVSPGLYREIMRVASVHGSVNSIRSYFASDPACRPADVDLTELRVMAMAIAASDPDLDPKVIEEYRSRMDRLQSLLDQMEALGKMKEPPAYAYFNIALKLQEMEDEPSVQEVVRRQRVWAEMHIDWCREHEASDDCPEVLVAEEKREEEHERRQQEKKAQQDLAENYTIGSNGLLRPKTFWEKLVGDP